MESYSRSDANLVSPTLMAGGLSPAWTPPGGTPPSGAASSRELCTPLPQPAAAAIRRWYSEVTPQPPEAQSNLNVASGSGAALSARADLAAAAPGGTRLEIPLPVALTAPPPSSPPKSRSAEPGRQQQQQHQQAQEGGQVSAAPAEPLLRARPPALESPVAPGAAAAAALKTPLPLPLPKGEQSDDELPGHASRAELPHGEWDEGDSGASSGADGADGAYDFVCAHEAGRSDFSDGSEGDVNEDEALFGDEEFAAICERATCVLLFDCACLPRCTKAASMP